MADGRGQLSGNSPPADAGSLKMAVFDPSMAKCTVQLAGNHTAVVSCTVQLAISGRKPRAARCNCPFPTGNRELHGAIAHFRPETVSCTMQLAVADRKW